MSESEGKKLEWTRHLSAKIEMRAADQGEAKQGNTVAKIMTFKHRKNTD